MRIIKFRAWDKEQDLMLYFSFKNIAAEGAVVCNKGECIDLNDNLPVMQYTGLKDKNGVEIYEGDLVKFTRPYWDNDGNCIRRETINEVKFKRGSFTYGGFQEDCFYVPSKKVEVIGNVYQNPELLDNKEK
jgi:uncharacterized phage protein (TIGR01671 family)